MLIRQYKNYTKVEKTIFWYAYFVTFPVIIILFNISFFLFLILLTQISFRSKGFLRINSIYNFFPVLFALGAFLSFYNSIDISTSGNVLLNYFYWPLLLIVIYNIRDQLEISVIFNALFYSLCSSIIYFYFLQNLGLRSIPIFNNFSQNSFSFLLICFTPISLFTFKEKFGTKTSLIFAIILLLSAFYSGSRAGSLLVTLGILAVYLFEKANIRKLAFSGIIIVSIVYLTFDSEILKNSIFSLNQRTYELLYNRDFVLKNDRSYLTRVAMIEKGLEMYNENKKFGTGLNTFQDVEVTLPGDFEGSKYVINKKDFQTVSSHNSYINLLAEGGLFLFIPFILILASAIIPSLLKVSKLNGIQRIILVSIILMAIHLYFISAILNVFAWFLLAIGLAFFNKRSYVKR